MALIVCPECGKEISDKSKNCINCGYKMQRKIPKYILYIIIFILFIFCLLLVINQIKLNEKIENFEKSTLTLESKINELQLSEQNKNEEISILKEEISQIPEIPQNIDNEKTENSNELYGEYPVVYEKEISGSHSTKLEIKDAYSSMSGSSCRVFAEVVLTDPGRLKKEASSDFIAIKYVVYNKEEKVVGSAYFNLKNATQSSVGEEFVVSTVLLNNKYDYNNIGKIEICNYS